ncbi:hypothetical protein EV368DRAFT_88516 [Lentinula lateritia]|nr:hypothetical protein EV368DRAFT_88516 [Lentinula lateritia]
MSTLQDSEFFALATIIKSRREGLRSAEKNLTINPIISSSTSSEAPVIPVESSSATSSQFPTKFLPTETCSSPLQFSSDKDKMSTRVNESGRIKLSTGKSRPCVKAGSVLSPEDLDDLYEDARLLAKDDIENVRDTIAEAFSARVHRDWFHAEKATHLVFALELVESDMSAPPTFPFLDVLRRKFCGHDWAQVHASCRDRLHMAVGGVGCFDEYLSQVESCNNRLKGVGNYLSPPQLLTILACGIAPTLTAKQGIVIDEAISADHQDRHGVFPYNSSSTTDNNNSVAHKQNTTSEPGSYPNKCPSSTNGPSVGAGLSGVFYMKSFKSMPKALQKEQRELLGRISTCPKCWGAWATCGSNLNNCAGAMLSVPWRPLTPEMVDWAISAHKSTNWPILYNAILKQAANKMPVASVHGAPLEDISAYVDDTGRHAPIAAAIYGNLPVSHIARDTAVYGSFAAPALFHNQVEIASLTQAPRNVSRTPLGHELLIWFAP